MSDKYSKEILLCNKFHTYLVDNQFTILQIICPGAQATYSITYTGKEGDKKKTIFPDCIFLKDSAIFIGEMKPKFSNSDKLKLLNLKMAKDGATNIKSLIKRVLKIDVSNYKIHFCLVHGDPIYKIDDDINQIILLQASVLFI